jgi:hypothetical protein
VYGKKPRREANESVIMPMKTVKGSSSSGITVMKDDCGDRLGKTAGLSYVWTDDKFIFRYILHKYAENKGGMCCV